MKGLWAFRDKYRLFWRVIPFGHVAPLNDMATAQSLWIPIIGIISMDYSLFYMLGGYEGAMKHGHTNETEDIEQEMRKSVWTRHPGGICEFPNPGKH